MSVKPKFKAVCLTHLYHLYRDKQFCVRCGHKRSTKLLRYKKRV